MNKYEKALADVANETVDRLADGYYQPKTVEHFHSEAIDILRELVEKATPKKIITDGSSYSTCDKVQYICPNCKKIMLRAVCARVTKPNYCYNCGQKIDWSDKKC